jgi:hypothetical protein
LLKCSDNTFYLVKKFFMITSLSLFRVGRLLALISGLLLWIGWFWFWIQCFFRACNRRSFFYLNYALLSPFSVFRGGCFGVFFR